MTAEAAALRRALAERIAEKVSLADPAWRVAVEAIPRECFLGAAVFRPNGSSWEPVRRVESGEEAWMRLAYSDETWVTQVEGIRAADAAVSLVGNPTSSSTLPSLVVRMLEVAGIRDGDKVLEIGTGTGYSTAILCHRLGEENVTSIEYDAGIARQAAENLGAAGYAPNLVVGDGLLGHKEGAEYDAVIATCAVRHIPVPWLWQVRDGGSITTAVGGWLPASGLVRLALADDDIASGRFTGDRISYMLARPHERPPHPVFHRYEGETRRSRLDPHLTDDWTGGFVAQLAAPSAELMTAGDNVILRDIATGSQAWTEATKDGWIVHQHGPLRLWDQVEGALMAWREAGSPDQSAFGITVAADLTQTVWAENPEGPSWRLPA
ncbi:ATP-grasp peptide maturase system methyltransferase [Embleya sp. NBC_00896]|uniref:ATP-grasp peptide maturase system methyltransferase n=1 Tax=Embleya sp. NBC_00896 TaxID=2975961 RepID=UPI00386E71C8|nr:ATP-grasp peptide maturase system methyltransferase [Embleya sp. NBC_00896]